MLSDKKVRDGKLRFVLQKGIGATVEFAPGAGGLHRSGEIPVDYKEISFVCLRPDGCLELPSTLSIACRSVAKRLDGFENFHFHQLRHTYTSNLLSNGAAPKDVQELLGHSDVSTTMNVYAHSTRKAKRNSARLLDKVAGND